MTTNHSGTNKGPRVVFLGSGPVATKSVELLSKYFDIEAVITKPTTIHDIQNARINGDPDVYAVSTRKELDDLVSRTSFDSTAAILIDFGIIVSQQVIDTFPFGIINSHFSLLPEWRGADPITFSVLSGQAQTGVSLMMLVRAMDEGPLLAVDTYDIGPKETTPTLTDRLIHLSADLLHATVPQYLAGSIAPISQQDFNTKQGTPRAASYSRKLTKADGVLDFTKSAEALEREIRAFAGWPGSRTTIAGKDCIIIDATADTTLSGTPGQAFKMPSKQLGVYANNGALIIGKLKPAGKQAMTAQAFLTGYGKDIPTV